ncbi:metal-dependent transcriptional regulator [Myxococcota bacterium]|nr:metal-dependent transcriptional regulator [Myxococcota bacterium]MBU1432470.1 metal-dependent transcriptional regulator [Myxococcota bacterium]MBU1900404.1 metal-dependent transcriptional regulator [Myxococcota bacterium]
MSPTLTSALEDYLETIYELMRDRDYARVRDISNAREVKAASVTPALKRLAEMGLVDYVQREYVRLTPEGRREAQRVLARHHLLRRLLGEILQVPPDEAERDACALEHSLSNAAMDGLVRFFEFIGLSPEGERFVDQFHAWTRQPKPEEGTLFEDTQPSHSVHDLAPGQRGRVLRIGSVGAIRQRLLDMGLLPNAEVEVERRAPTGEPIWIRVGGAHLALRGVEAKAIRVALV